MPDCVYCTSPEIRERAIVRETLVWAFPTNIPIVPGHVLVAPVRHMEKFIDLTRKERDAFFDLAMRLRPTLSELFGAEGFHFAWNEGAVAGQSVPHLHLHMVPRKAGDAGVVEHDPRRFLYRPGSREATPEAELQAVSKSIKEKLRDGK